MQPKPQRIPGAHGLSLQLFEWSDAGPPLLFLHGFGHGARIWDPFVPPLAKHYRVLALDARGHGDSDRDPEYRYSHAAVSRDLTEVIESLDLDPVVLVAHSMGGTASILYAARYPERVAQLVLVDAGPELSTQSRAGRGVRRAGVDRSFADAKAYRVVLARLHPRADPAALEHWAEHGLRRRSDGRYEAKLDPAFLRPKSASDPANRRRFDRATWARQEEERLWRHLAQISCPTLVVRGEHSDMLSATTQERMVREGLPDGRAVTIPGAGHVVMLDAPEALREALGSFLLDPSVLEA